MDSYDREAPALRHSPSIISQCSDGTSSTVAASPTSKLSQRCTCHTGFLCPHHDTDTTRRRAQKQNITATDSPSSNPEMFPISPTSTERSTTTLNSPSWEQPSKFGGWGYHGYKPHMDDGDDDRRLLKPAQDEALEDSWKPPKTDPNFYCSAAKDIHKPCSHWLPIILLIGSVYSTVFSGIWFALAVKKQAWGNHIKTHGKLSPSTASLFFALIAKSIELSFAAIFMAVLGQWLSRKALSPYSHDGISIIDMSMRSWVVQPSTILTTTRGFRYWMLSRLGIPTVVAALLVMFYTTASNVLVLPKVNFGDWQPKNMTGNVSTQFANVYYINNRCQTPISPRNDPGYSGETCIEIEHAGQAYHNYMQYLGQWSWTNTSRKSSPYQAQRQDPVAMLYDNTTVKGSWIEVHDMSAVSSKHNRMVNNVTMAFPHAGVFTAAHDPSNGIIQPSDLENIGEYRLMASVPSPSINVLCSSANATDLRPLVDGQSHNANELRPRHFTKSPPRSLMNKTNLDDVFAFGIKYNRSHPTFSRLPNPNNTVIGETVQHGDSLYILAAAPESDYVMCSFRVFLSPNCSTRYNASQQGGALYSHCEDKYDQFRYDYDNPNAPTGFLNQDWVNVADSWAHAISLGDGVADFNASNARLLTQLIPTRYTLDPLLPSIAEALAVLAGCTLLISSLDSPFVHYWNHTTPNLTIPEPQSFKALLQSKQYMSGGSKPWQGVLHVVLALTLAFNCGCLFYLIKRFVSKDSGLITDFTEPQNTFTLAMNSPPSQSLAGACGCGPSNEQFRIRWRVRHDKEHDHYYLSDGHGRVEEGQWEKPDFEQLSMEGSPAISVSPQL